MIRYYELNTLLLELLKYLFLNDVFLLRVRHICVVHILISLHTYDNTSKPHAKLRMSSIYPLYKYAQGIRNNTKPLPVAGNNHDSFVINGTKTQEVKYIAEICVQYFFSLRQLRPKIATCV